MEVTVQIRGSQIMTAGDSEWSIDQVFVVENFLRSRVSSGVFDKKRVIPEAPLGLIKVNYCSYNSLAFLKCSTKEAFGSSFVYQRSMFFYYTLCTLARNVSPVYEKLQSCIAS